MDLKIEYADVSSLVPYERNARKHSEDDVNAIIKSIEEFGFNDRSGFGRIILSLKDTGGYWRLKS